MFFWILNFMIGFHWMEMLIYCKSPFNKRLICYVVYNKNITMCAKLVLLNYLQKYKIFPSVKVLKKQVSSDYDQTLLDKWIYLVGSSDK